MKRQFLPELIPKSKKLKKLCRMPSTIRDVKIYFSQKGMPDYEAENFYQFYEKNTGKVKMDSFLKTGKISHIDGLLLLYKINHCYSTDGFINLTQKEKYER